MGANGLIVSHYAISGPGPEEGKTMFPDRVAGHEGSHFDECLNYDKLTPQQQANIKCKEVKTITIDRYLKKHIDRRDTKKGRRIPFLSIDIEGYDFSGMKAGRKTLQRTDYLEFEYHVAGDWGKQKLEDAVNMLKGHGFVCYWAGVNKLWRITDCWMDRFEHHGWSNVACVNPKYQPALARKMEDVFTDTLAGY